MIDFIYPILLVALIVAVWIDVSMLHRKMKEVDAQLKYIYYLLYYQYYSSYNQSQQEDVEQKEEVEEDKDAVKEACVVELVNRRGCIAMEEVVTLCDTSKSFIINKLYRKKKVVKVDREYKTICPK
jgi:Ca2+/Na+ antiporter